MSWVIISCMILVLGFVVAPLLVFGAGLVVFNLIEKYGIPKGKKGE